MPPSPMPEARLEVLAGTQKGVVVPLGATAVTFGRAPGNTFVVRDSTVSRQHAKVFDRDGRHFIADLNSSHGTFVNGAKVTLHELHAGDEVTIGTTALRYLTGVAPSIASPTSDDANFELELELPTAPTAVPSKPPTSAPPNSPKAPPKPLPPVNTNYRRAVSESGEDPFAEEGSAATQAPEATARERTGRVDAEMPQIEMRGRTAEQFASRGSGSPLPPAASGAGSSAKAHVAPALARGERRRRGPFAFLSDELDQRGPFARGVAALFALAVAGGLLWITLRLIDSTPRASVNPDEKPDGTQPIGSERPSLPTKH